MTTGSAVPMDPMGAGGEPAVVDLCNSTSTCIVDAHVNLLRPGSLQQDILSVIQKGQDHLGSDVVQVQIGDGPMQVLRGEQKEESKPIAVG